MPKLNINMYICVFTDDDYEGKLEPIGWSNITSDHKKTIISEMQQYLEFLREHFTSGAKLCYKENDLLRAQLLDSASQFKDVVETSDGIAASFDLLPSIIADPAFDKLFNAEITDGYFVIEHGMNYDDLTIKHDFQHMEEDVIFLVGDVCIY